MLGPAAAFATWKVIVVSLQDSIIIIVITIALFYSSMPTDYHLMTHYLFSTSPYIHYDLKLSAPVSQP